MQEPPSPCKASLPWPQYGGVAAPCRKCWQLPLPGARSRPTMERRYLSLDGDLSVQLQLVAQRRRRCNRPRRLPIPAAALSGESGATLRTVSTAPGPRVNASPRRQRVWRLEPPFGKNHLGGHRHLDRCTGQRMAFLKYLPLRLRNSCRHQLR